MVTLTIIGTAFIGVLLAALASQLASEFRDWTPRWTEWLINKAVQRLPAELQERMAEEWREFISDTPGHMARVIRAVGLNFAALRVSAELSETAGLLEYVCTRLVALALLIFIAPMMVIAIIVVGIVQRGGPVFEKPKGQKFYRFCPTDNHNLKSFLGRTHVQDYPALWNFVRGDVTLTWAQMGKVAVDAWRSLFRLS
jgi:hypothetical protein